MEAHEGAVPVAELDEAELRAWGEAYGRSLQQPAWLTLEGELGAGKTTLVQAIALGLGVTEPVTSPTYAIVHQYAALGGPVHHLDLYRLRDPSELAQLGWDDLVRSPGVVLVEWPDRAGDALPVARRSITLQHVIGHPHLRRLTWTE
jgi:tRNA threonylcarbamoyladenosine biosynthesis protein TsaE